MTTARKRLPTSTIRNVKMHSHLKIVISCRDAFSLSFLSWVVAASILWAMEERLLRTGEHSFNIICFACSLLPLSISETALLAISTHWLNAASYSAASPSRSPWTLLNWAILSLAAARLALISDFRFSSEALSSVSIISRRSRAATFTLVRQSFMAVSAAIILSRSLLVLLSIFPIPNTETAVRMPPRKIMAENTANK